MRILILPVSADTQIEYDLTTSVSVTLRIHREDHAQAKWDGTDAQGRPLGSGLYFYRLQARLYTKTRTMGVGQTGSLRPTARPPTLS